MSIAALLLSWTNLPQWVKEAILVFIIVACAVAGLKYHDHQVFKSGIAAQQAVDAKQAAAQVAAIDAQRKLAEKNYAKSQKDLSDFVAAYPVQPVRLCLNKIVLPTAPVAEGGNSVAPTGVLQQVPAGDNRGGAGAAGPDISLMLGALAARADAVTAAYRSQVQ